MNLSADKKSRYLARRTACRCCCSRRYGDGGMGRSQGAPCRAHTPARRSIRRHGRRSPSLRGARRRITRRVDSWQHRVARRFRGQRPHRSVGDKPPRDRIRPAGLRPQQPSTRPALDAVGPGRIASRGTRTVERRATGRRRSLVRHAGCAGNGAGPSGGREQPGAAWGLLLPNRPRRRASDSAGSPARAGRRDALHGDRCVWSHVNRGRGQGNVRAERRAARVLPGALARDDAAADSTPRQCRRRRFPYAGGRGQQRALQGTSASCHHHRRGRRQGCRCRSAFGAAARDVPQASSLWCPDTGHMVHYAVQERIAAAVG